MGRWKLDGSPKPEWELSNLRQYRFRNPETCNHMQVRCAIETNRGICKNCGHPVKDTRALIQTTFVFEQGVSGSGW